MEQQTGGVDLQPARLSRWGNTRSPVFTLPVDVLLEIFSALKDSSGHKLQQWLQITHTCTSWPHLALASRSLWTHIYDTPHDFIPVMLERSRGAPLHVSFFRTPPSSIMSVILREIERIKTLALYNIGSADVLDTIENILADLGNDWEASLLESLSVRCPSILLVLHFRATRVLGMFRPTHRLRKLSLLGGHYRWSRVLPLPNLTELVLKGEIVGGVSGSLFLETLRQMPNLRVLDLDWEGLNLTQYPPTPLPQHIHLPRLEKLGVKNSNQGELESFLSLLVHPQLRQFLVGLAPMTIIQSLRDIALGALVQSVVPSIGKGRFTQLEFLDTDFDSVNFSTGTALCNHSYLRLMIPIEEEYDFGEEEDDASSLCSSFDILSSVMKFIPPDVILPRHVKIDTIDATADRLTHLSSMLPCMESIELHQTLAMVLFGALSVPSALETTTPEKPIHFSALRGITLHGDKEWDQTGPIFSKIEFDNICDVLLARRARDASIIRLELVSCKVLGEIEVRRLQEIGLEVIVPPP